MLYKIFSYNSFLVDEALKRIVYTHKGKIRRESKEWYKLHTNGVWAIALWPQIAIANHEITSRVCQLLEIDR